MEALGKIVAAIAAVCLMLFFILVLGPVIGAVSGLVVGWLFEPSIWQVFAAFGVDLTGIAMWQLGAVLAFVGGFFKAAYSSTGKKGD
jgi:hypothetical protein